MKSNQTDNKGFVRLFVFVVQKSSDHLAQKLLFLMRFHRTMRRIIIIGIF